MKDTKLCDCGHRIEELQAAHQQELVEVDNKWHMCLEQQLTEAEARYKEELTELSKEWQWERKVQFYFNFCAVRLVLLCVMLDIIGSQIVQSLM